MAKIQVPFHLLLLKTYNRWLKLKYIFLLLLLLLWTNSLYFTVVINSHCNTLYVEEWGIICHLKINRTLYVSVYLKLLQSISIFSFWLLTNFYFRTYIKFILFLWIKLLKVHPFNWSLFGSLIMDYNFNCSRH